MKLWDFETGNAVFDFGEAHGDAAITCLDFDTTGRRCLTGGRDGGIKIWNYNNGHCLMTLRNRKCSYIIMIWRCTMLKLVLLVVRKNLVAPVWILCRQAKLDFV